MILTRFLTVAALIAFYAPISQAYADDEASREVLVSNNRVCVVRVTIPPGATYEPDHSRADRVIIWLTDNRSERHARRVDGKSNLPQDRGEQLLRFAGDAAFRPASNHSITNKGPETQVSVVVELAPCPKTR